MYELIVETHFGAAHRLRGYDGECENLHGHNWHLTVRLAGEKLNGLGMVMDFKEVKDLLNRVLDRLDHRYLNEVEPFDRLNPTTEHIAEYVARELSGQLPEPVRVSSVTCWESDNCGATVRWGERRAGSASATGSAGGGEDE